MNLLYGAPHDATPDCILEGFVEGPVRTAFVSVQHQVEGGTSGAVMSLLPTSQSVSPEAPKLRGVGCNPEISWRWKASRKS